MSPGTTLHGYCNGYFGRDSYGEKIVIACGEFNGDLWVVAQEGDDLVFASGFPQEVVSEWITPESDED